jgi:phosphate:Na+ symporter
LTEEQIERLSKVRIANRNMVEIVKKAGDLTHNISKYMFSENMDINNEYSRLRKKIVKAIRVAYRTKTRGMTTKFQKKISDLPELFEERRRLEERRIDKLIRKDMIDDDMSSSLVNDYETVNDIVLKLLTVTSLLFDNQDILLESSNKK